MKLSKKVIKRVYEVLRKEGISDEEIQRYIHRYQDTDVIGHYQCPDKILPLIRAIEYLSEVQG
jgi:predicted house-cleaning NTP pyrophosphatase (Maf/HAM1 superfamily)